MHVLHEIEELRALPRRHVPQPVLKTRHVIVAQRK
jgi:hypothetical protein